MAMPFLSFDQSRTAQGLDLSGKCNMDLQFSESYEARSSLQTGRPKFSLNI